jgi:hypothetical protein
MTDLPFAILSSFVNDAYPKTQGFHNVIWMGLSRIPHKFKKQNQLWKKNKKKSRINQSMILKLQIIFQFLEWLGHLGPFGTDRPLSLLSSPGKDRFCQKKT